MSCINDLMCHGCVDIQELKLLGTDTKRVLCIDDKNTDGIGSILGKCC